MEEIRCGDDLRFKLLASWPPSQAWVLLELDLRVSGKTPRSIVFVCDFWTNPIRPTIDPRHNIRPAAGSLADAHA